jgi:hypothetical protein
MLSIPSPPIPAVRGGARARAPAILGAVLALLIGLLAALALRAPAGPGQASPAGPGQASPAGPSGLASAAFPPGPGLSPPGAQPTTGAVPGPRAAVTARLHEILRIREQAFGRRDTRLLETVYTADCPCLRSGRAAIARLLADRAVWRGRSVAVEIGGLRRVAERMWIAVALFSSRPFRIEREDGTLVRAVPAGRQRYRFLLVQPPSAGALLLGDAALLQGDGP